MQTLSITNSEGQQIVSVQIADVDPTEATVAVLTALKTIKAPRKTRADAGKPRANSPQ